MALHTKWTSGDLTFYDATQDVFKIKDNDEGCIFGESASGIDVKFWGDTTGAYMLWDEDQDDLLFAGGASIELAGGNLELGDSDYIYFGDEPDMSMRWSTGSTGFVLLPAVTNSEIYFGSTSLALKVQFFGASGTTGFVQWDSSGAKLIFDQADIKIGDNDYIGFGDTGDGDITMSWDSDSFNIIPHEDHQNVPVEFGTSTGGSLNIKFYGSTGSKFMQWNSSGEVLTFDDADIALGDDDNIKFGDTGDVSIRWTTGQLEVVPTSAYLDLVFGSTDTPLDIKLIGATGGTGNTIIWSASGDVLTFDQTNLALGDNDYIYFGDGPDLSMRWSTSSTGFEIIPDSTNAELYLGSTDLALKVKFFGASGTTGFMQWDSSASKLIFEQADINMGDDDYITFGDTSGGNVMMSWDSDSFNIVPTSTSQNVPVEFGTSTGGGLNIKAYGSTGANFIQWVSSGDILTLDNADIELGDDDSVIFGDSGDVAMRWSSGIFEVVPTSGEVTMYFGASGKPFNIITRGTTDAAYMQWLATGDALKFDGADINMGDMDNVIFGDSTDVSIRWTTGILEILPAAEHSNFNLGTTSYPLDVKFFVTTGSTGYMQWSSTGDELVFDTANILMKDADYIKFGDTGDISMRWTTGDVFEVLPLVANSDMYLGSTDSPLDVVNFGNVTYRAPFTNLSNGSTDNITLTSTDSQMQFLNTCGEATTVTLPSTTGSVGVEFKIYSSTKSGDITINDTGTNTIAIVAADELGIFICDGSRWVASIAGASTS